MAGSLLRLPPPLWGRSDRARCARAGGGVTGPQNQTNTPLPIPPPQGQGYRIWSQKLDEKGIVPPCTLDFSAHRSGARVGAEDVEDEPAQDGQVLRGVVFSRSAAVLVQDDIEHPMQLILDRPMRTLDAQ